MNSKDLRQEIEIKRPRYLIKYKPLLEAISNKGTSGGGDYVRFGPFYQTYMYAFMIGYRKGECVPIVESGDKSDTFADMSHWRPSAMLDYILMLILSESKEKMNFTWMELEAMKEEEGKDAVKKIITRIEGYANAGLEHLQTLYNTKKEMFRDPFVFVNILRDIK